MARSAVRVATIHQWGKDEIKFAMQAAQVPTFAKTAKVGQPPASV